MVTVQGIRIGVHQLAALPRALHDANPARPGCRQALASAKSSNRLRRHRLRPEYDATRRPPQHSGATGRRPATEPEAPKLDDPSDGSRHRQHDVAIAYMSLPCIGACVGPSSTQPDPLERVRAAEIKRRTNDRRHLAPTSDGGSEPPRRSMRATCPTGARAREQNAPNGPCGSEGAYLCESLESMSGAGSAAERSAAHGSSWSGPWTKRARGGRCRPYTAGRRVRAADRALTPE